MRRFIILTIFSGLLIAGFVFAESHKPPPPLSQGQPGKLQAQPRNNSDVNPATTKEITNTLPTPVIDKGVSTLENSSSNTSGNENTSRNVPCNDDPMIHYTFWLMIFTGVLAISTIGLWFVTFLAGKDTKKAADAAQKSADVAEKTVETIADTAQKQLRAYVFTKLDNKFTISSDDILSVTIQIKNFGQTPADDLIASLKIGLFKLPITATNKLDEPSYDSEASKSPLAPGASDYQGLSFPERLTKDIISDIEAGNGAFFIIGEAKYIDIFKNPHSTKICLFSTGEDFTRRNLLYYHEGNDAD